MAFVPVESSNVAAVAYDDKTHTLYVALKRGLRYFYQAVPQTVYTELLNAQSKGKYLNKEIIGRYKYGNI
ncbi:MAG: KTSC domain-containing protein [Verrucomicrobia bacterium]|nr:KTSC domain-containing protein [Verrucomicrobiota bacterium]